MVGTETLSLQSNNIDFHSYLPSYRSLLTPNARYDYKTHSLIPISQHELNSIRLVNHAKKHSIDNGQSSNQLTHNNSINSNNATSKIKMKYKSLLSDVSRRTSILSMKINNNSMGTTIHNQLRHYQHSIHHHLPQYLHLQKINHQQHPVKQRVKIQLKNLPPEVLIHIFSFIDDFQSYKFCLYVNKQFYQLSKPFLYSKLSFNSTYRFSQFITYLRLNKEIGYDINEIDLSNIKPGNYEFEEYENSKNNQSNTNQNTNNTHNTNNTNNFNQIENDNENTIVNLHDSLKDDDSPKILAGWRDWKFKNNPLYSIHPYNNTLTITNGRNNSFVNSQQHQQHQQQNNLVKIQTNKSNHSNKSFNSKKKLSNLNFLKSRKRHKSNLNKSTKIKKIQSNSNLNLNRKPNSNVIDLKNSFNSYKPLIHPSTNKFLLSYQSSKDLPIGYILHLINLCPNLISLNLGNLSLSIDYEINKSMIYKYQPFDLMNNYSKDMIKTIDNIINFNDNEMIFNGSNINHDQTDYENFQSSSFQQSQIQNQNISNNTNSNQSINQYQSSCAPSSSASSLFSVPTFSKPIRKYNSLLPPLPTTVNDISYLSKGDGKVYLSDLNLKSINNDFLKTLNEDELLSTIIKLQQKNNHQKLIIKRSTTSNNHHHNHNQKRNIKYHPSLKYINLSSMIWLTKKFVQDFLRELIDDDIFKLINLDEINDDDNNDFNDDNEFDENYNESEDIISTDNLIIDLTDSGMYKNLKWATIIDLNKILGIKLAHKIINDKLLVTFDDHMRLERIRRGHIAENYFHH